MAKQKKETFNSPLGEAKFPWINKPQTKWKPEGEYKVDLRLKTGSPEEQAFIGQINAWVDEAFNNFYNEAKPAQKKKLNKHYPYTEELDAEGEETGYTLFKFGTAAQFTDKTTQEIKEVQIRQFDRFGNKLDGTKAIFGGSLLIVNFTPGPYTVQASGMTGVKLYLNAVMVKEFAAAGGGENPFGGMADAPEASEAPGDDDGDSPPF